MRLTLVFALLVLVFPATQAGASWWQDEPMTTEETELLSEFARDQLPPDFSGVDFAEVRTRKQKYESRRSEEQPKRTSSESLYFYGAFPDSLNNGDYRERYAIWCVILSEYAQSEVMSKREDCNQGVERLLTYEGVESEVELDEVVELDVARALLDFLATQIGPVRGQPLITRSDFSELDRIGIRNGRPKRVVVYWTVGSTTFSLSYEISTDDGYVFLNRRDESYVTD